MSSGLSCTVQLCSFRPRSQNCRFGSVSFNSHDLNKYNSVPSFDSDEKLGKVNSGFCQLKKDFVLSAKQGLTVDKEVDVEGNGGVSKERSNFDAIVIGSGIGGLVAATQLAVKGARVLVLEKYVIPGGSSGYYQRDGYTFDVGSSVMFGFSDKVSSNFACLVVRE